ncbi:MAG TPA: chalcone isomerase [Leucothrix mucor]|nr:chalcone isomerase [Leucothrix mucor]
MRFLTCFFVALFTFFISVVAHGYEIGGITCPDKFLINGKSLILNGAGVRSRYVLPLYTSALYLKARSDDGNQIIAANDAMVIRLRIISPIVATDVVTAAIAKAFNGSMNGKTGPLKLEIKKITDLFKSDLKYGDEIDLIYHPHVGTKIIKNGRKLLVIKSLAFKKALFGIWLSDNPVQKTLYKEMLGGGLENRLFN